MSLGVCSAWGWQRARYEHEVNLPNCCAIQDSSGWENQSVEGREEANGGAAFAEN